MGFAEVLGEGGEGTNSERGIGGSDNAEVVGEGGEGTIANLGVQNILGVH